MNQRDNSELNSPDNSVDFGIRKTIVRAMIDDSLEDRTKLETLYHSLPWEERDVLDRISANLSGDDVEQREKIVRGILVFINITPDAIDTEYESILKFKEAFSETLPEMISDPNISPPEKA